VLPRIGANINPRLFVADAVGAFFVLVFLYAHHNNVGLDLPVGVDRRSAVTPIAVDFDVLVKLKLWMRHLISSLWSNTGFLRSPQIP
jgi:hypothetical protein